MFKFVVASILVALVATESHHGHQDHIVDYHAHPRYEFKYGVEDHHTGDVHSAHEVRDGDETHGEYSLVEPDGTVRKVQYSVNKHSGFNAVVTKSGHLTNPSGHASREQPVAVHHVQPAVAVHHVQPVAVSQVQPATTLHHAPVAPAHGYEHGHATSYSSVVQHHQPVHHH